MLGTAFSLYRSAYNGLSPSTWWLSVIMLVNRSGTMVVPFMTIYLTSPRMGYSIGEAGIVLGLFGIGAFVGGFLGGKVTDRIGFYPVQIITLIGGGILFIILGHVTSFPLICLFAFLLSLVNEAFRPANSAAIAFYSKIENRTRSYSLNRLAINLGWAVGGAVGGILASINYQLLFWVDGVTNICAAFLMLYFLPFSASKTNLYETTSPAASPYRDKKFLRFIALTTLYAACFFQLFSTMPAYYKNELHFSTAFIGLLMALNGLVITFVEMVVVFKLEGTKANTYFIARGILLCAIAYLLLNLPVVNHMIAVVMMLLITVGEILSMPFMNSFWLSRTSVANRGQYAGLYTMGWSAAQTCGPLLGAQVAEHWGYESLWWSVSAACFLAASGFFIYLKNQ